MGARFSAPFQNGPAAHPASYTLGTESFTGVKRPGRGVDHQPPSSAEVKERVELYIYSTSGPSWPLLGRTLPLPLILQLNTIVEQTNVHKYTENSLYRPHNELHISASHVAKGVKYK